MVSTRSERLAKRQKWENFGYKLLKKKAIDAAVQGSLGYATGGPSGALKGVADTIMEGIKEENNASSSFKNKNKSGIMAVAGIRRRSPRKYTKKRKVVKKRSIYKKRGKKGRGNKKITKATLIKNGITVKYEKRKSTSTALGEAVVIGHTNMPSKFCAVNMWRAILKYVHLKSGFYIKDYSALMSAFGFKAGDIIRVNWFTTAQTVVISKLEYTVTLTSTFDEVAYFMAFSFSNGNLDDRAGDRLNSMQIVPIAGNESISPIVVEINTLKITVQTTSCLKIQNVTQETAGADEAVDVTRVPLVGKEFVTKGNNLMKKANNEIIPGLYSAVNDDALYQGWTKQVATSASDIDYYSNNNQSSFYKPAEVPRKQDFVNCISEKNTQIGPGEIAVSTITGYFTFGLNYYFKLLYTSGAAKNNIMNYEARLGKTKAFYLEKMIGRKGNEGINEIKLWSELEVSQSVLVHGPYGLFTLPINYQIDYDA